jgi:hypothetical protein
LRQKISQVKLLFFGHMAVFEQNKDCASNDFFELCDAVG